MTANGHPWECLDEIQTMWRLGRDISPPLPESIVGKMADFLQSCFVM
jgi:hypothetical protein